MSPESRSVALSVRDVRLRWPGAGSDVFHIPHLEVRAGETVFLRGESGCGKSSLLSLLSGVALPSAGRVQCLGQDWQALSAAQRDRFRADHLGYLFQQFNLLPYLSVLDNVLLPCRLSPSRARRAGGQAQQQRAAAEGLLAALQLAPELWGREAVNLSVGQQQRVAAARALIGKPAVVLADEPTSALDEQRRDAFMGLLMQVCQQAGSALLFVSHDRQLARYFDRVLEWPQLQATNTSTEVSSCV